MLRYWTVRPNDSRPLFLPGGGATAGSLLVPEVLRARERARQAGPGKSSPAQAAIVIYLQGGLSHYESFDPKPLAPSAYRGEFQPASTSVPGTHFCEHLPQLSARANKINVYHQLGVPTDGVFYDSLNRPIPVLASGQPIRELLA